VTNDGRKDVESMSIRSILRRFDIDSTFFQPSFLTGTFPNITITNYMRQMRRQFVYNCKYFTVKDTYVYVVPSRTYRFPKCS